MSTQKGLLIFLTLALAYFARAVFVPFFLAVFLTILLDPFVIKLHTWKIPRVPGSILDDLNLLNERIDRPAA